MTDLERITEVADGYKRSLEARNKAFEMLSEQRLHDFRCAALSGLLSGVGNGLFTSDLEASKAMPNAMASSAEKIAQAMLKIARGE